MILAGGSLSELKELKKMTVSEYLTKLNIFAEEIIRDQS